MSSEFPGYGGKGPTILIETWTLYAVALSLWVLRAMAASRNAQSKARSFFGFRFDFVFITLAMVSEVRSLRESA